MNERAVPHARAIGSEISVQFRTRKLIVADHGRNRFSEAKATH